MQCHLENDTTSIYQILVVVSFSLSSITPNLILWLLCLRSWLLSFVLSFSVSLSALFCIWLISYLRELLAACTTLLFHKYVSLSCFFSCFLFVLPQAYLTALIRHSLNWSRTQLISLSSFSAAFFLISSLNAVYTSFSLAFISKSINLLLSHLFQ